jgi:hypothetical protein
MWVERRVEDTVEKKSEDGGNGRWRKGRVGGLHTAGMERGAGEAWDDAGCGSENTSGVDPIDQGSAVVDPSAGLQAE